jgi:hypothetical protein
MVEIGRGGRAKTSKQGAKAKDQKGGIRQDGYSQTAAKRELRLMRDECGYRETGKARRAGP